MGAADAETLGRECAAIDPWARIDAKPEAMTRVFAAKETCAPRYAIRLDGTLAGVAGVRFPWLKGPYLEVLAVLPPWQGQGLGGRFLDWFEREASGERNLWVLASDFNTRALAFYEGRGFHRVTPLPDVAVEGYTEIMLRKRLA